MYLIDEFKGRDDYEKLLYIEATSAGSVCTMARAMASNLRAYMSDSEIHPSVLLTLKSLEGMIAMRDDWLNRLRDLRHAEDAPLPFDEREGASVPIKTQAKAREKTKALAAVLKEDGADVDLIFDRAFAAVGGEPTPEEKPAPSRKRRTKRQSTASD